MDACYIRSYFAIALYLIKDGTDEGVAKIETTTDEVKPNSGERAKVMELAVTPCSEKEEPLFKSSLRVKTQPKQKVSSGF